jgi:thioredoxin 1
MNSRYGMIERTRAEIDSLNGATLVEFGAPWCGYCPAGQPLIDSALSRHREIRHIKVEDGKGRPLGRSFRITLWPTLIFLRDGKEIARLVRPVDAAAIGEALDKISGAA